MNVRWPPVWELIPTKERIDEEDDDIAERVGFGNVSAGVQGLMIVT